MDDDNGDNGAAKTGRVSLSPPPHPPRPSFVSKKKATRGVSKKQELSSSSSEEDEETSKPKKKKITQMQRDQELADRRRDLNNGKYCQPCDSDGNKKRTKPPSAAAAAAALPLKKRRKKKSTALMDEQDEMWAEYDRERGCDHPNNKGTVMDTRKNKPVNAMVKILIARFVNVIARLDRFP